MVDMQKEFISFHENIRLDYDDNSLLRKYRDEVLEGLKKNLLIDCSYSTFVQGSYAMHTGIKGTDIDIDFDIDIGLVLDMSREEFENPITVKKMIRDALAETFPNSNVEIKNPCVTVNFEKETDSVHVDVAIYLEEDFKSFYLARGKEFSSPENRVWEEADPKLLITKIKESHLDEDDRKQFRRCIRYLKRWKDIKFSQENKPNGIGLTVSALKNFSPCKDHDYFKGTKAYNDIDALKTYVRNMLSDFFVIYDQDDSKYYSRLAVKLPVRPFSDIYCRMTNKQMDDFKEKLLELIDALDFVSATLDKHEASKKLNNLFGDDFRIISEAEVTEESSRNAIVTDSPSA